MLGGIGRWRTNRKDRLSASPLLRGGAAWDGGKQAVRARDRGDLPADPKGKDLVESGRPAGLNCVHVVQVIAVGVRGGPGQIDADRRQIDDREVGRSERDRGKFAGHVGGIRVHMVYPGVDSRGVVLVASLERRGQGVEHRLELGRGVEVAPDRDIHRDVARAQDLRQVPGGRSAEGLQLEQAVLGGGVACAPPQLRIARASDRWHAVGVANDPDARHRILLRAGLVEHRVFALEVDERRLLVVQVRRSGAVGDPGNGDEAALPGRKDRSRLDDPRGRGRRQGEHEGESKLCRPDPPTSRQSALHLAFELAGPGAGQHLPQDVDQRTANDHAQHPAKVGLDAICGPGPAATQVLKLPAALD